jgi:hypothetical protein
MPVNQRLGRAYRQAIELKRVSNKSKRTSALIMAGRSILYREKAPTHHLQQSQLTIAYI